MFLTERIANDKPFGRIDHWPDGTQVLHLRDSTVYGGVGIAWSLERNTSIVVIEPGGKQARTGLGE